MTLKKLLEKLVPEINCPEDIGNLTVKNPDEYCHYALQNYFKSEKFKYELKMLNTSYALIRDCKVQIEFRRHNDRSFTISLKPTVLN